MEHAGISLAPEMGVTLDQKRLTSALEIEIWGAGDKTQVKSRLSCCAQSKSGA
jgi:hypothetical protein